jgi:hypothetical protein
LILSDDVYDFYSCKCSLSGFKFSFYNEIDAWGEVQLPQGSFDAIRQKTYSVLETKSDCYYDSARSLKLLLIEDPFLVAVFSITLITVLLIIFFKKFI